MLPEHKKRNKNITKRNETKHEFDIVSTVGRRGKD